jgi:fusicocca-2,10(14)-diene synthase/ophiobolin F synthase
MTMEYPNSVLVDPSTYPADMDGLCSGIPVRVSRHPELAVRGALRAQKEWKQAFGSLPPGFVGGTGPKHNLITVCWPETLPDRLEIVAFVTEIAFLVDDVMDSAADPLAIIGPFMADFLQAWQMVMGGAALPVLAASHSAVGQMVASFARDLVAVDAERAKDFFRWVERWATLSLTQHAQKKEVRNFDEYLEHRRVNIASE